MPTYEYACKSCGNSLEVVQKFTDDPLTECPSCGGALRKIFGSVGIAFKGSGFYKTDSRSSSGSTGKTGSDKGSDTKTDAASTTSSSGDGGTASKSDSSGSKAAS